MKRWALLLAALAIAPPAVAASECRCRYKGASAAEGETVCLATADGPRLARCERVLNNTSWTFLDAACPTAKLSLSRLERLAMRAAPLDPFLSDRTKAIPDR